MHVTCPHCQKPVDLPDSVADQAVPCPACGQTFTAPALLAGPAEESHSAVYAVGPTAPRPAYPLPPTAQPKPPAAERPAAERPAAAPATAPTTGVRFTVSRRGVHWVGPTG